MAASVLVILEIVDGGHAVHLDGNALAAGDDFHREPRVRRGNHVFENLESVEAAGLVLFPERGGLADEDLSLISFGIISARESVGTAKVNAAVARQVDFGFGAKMEILKVAALGEQMRGFR